MCRIPGIDPITASQATRQLFDRAEAEFGMVPMMVRTMAQSHAALAGWTALSGALAGGALSERTRVLISLAVAQANSSNYCLALHTALGERLGLEPQERLDARRGHAANAKESATLRLALAIVETRGRVSDDTLALSRAAGLTDAELCEVSAHVAINLLTNYFNRLADTDIDFPKVDARLPSATG
jgi:uncharacterized peroxidase-related enzyme